MAFNILPLQKAAATSCVAGDSLVHRSMICGLSINVCLSDRLKKRVIKMGSVHESTAAAVPDVTTAARSSTAKAAQAHRCSIRP